MSEEKGARPTHELKLLDKETEDTARVGVAWKRDSGAFSIKLNPGVVLSYDNLKGKVLTLFPVRTDEEWDAFHDQKRKQEPRPAGSYSPDGRSWKDNHPEYVRKVHFAPAEKRDCSNRHQGKPDVTDDPTKVTCGRCKKVAQRQPAPVVPIKPPQGPPPEPTPAA